MQPVLSKGIADPFFQRGNVVHRSQRLKFFDLEAHCLSKGHRFAASSAQKNAERLRWVVAKINRWSGIAINAVFARIGDDSHDACRGQLHRQAADSETAANAGGSADVPVREAFVYH